MALLGWATAGASAVWGQSKVYLSLPFKGWRETSAWLEEAIDAIGADLDFLDFKFLRALSKANLLDPAYVPSTIDPATASTANTTTAPLGASSQTSMLDVLLYITLGYFPADTNLGVAIKQKLAQVGWAALRRKGTRLQMLNIASKVSGGPALGWTVPPFNFSIILPDGTPSPGQGVWTPPSATAPAVNRPWAFQAIRKIMSNGIAPDWSNIGVGLSQFRAGYSAAGETVFPVGARTNILVHEHFDAWTAGVPTGWTKTGTGTLTQSTSAAQINWEFTGNAAVFDQTGASAGIASGLSQATIAVNNQIKHHLQIDYAYSNTQGVSTLLATIVDNNGDGNVYYWNPTMGAWSTAVCNIPLPMSAARARYATDITMQAASSTGTTQGTTAVTVNVFTTSDGTPTAKVSYTIYRAGLYESFDLAIETAALGERTLWTPLVDASGWTSTARVGGTVGTFILEMANAQRTAYKLIPISQGAHFPYHPALNGRTMRSFGTWTNLLKGGGVLSSDWALTNATRSLSAVTPPTIGTIVSAATELDAAATGAKITQGSLGTPTSKTYVGGVWVKKLSTDGNFTDFTVSAISTSTKSQTFAITQAQGWQLLPFKFAFGTGDTAALSLAFSWGAASPNGSIGIIDAYLYDVTANPGVLYPPVVRSGVGSTAATGVSTCLAITASQGVNVLHPLTQRALASVNRGSLGVTVVPTFDAGSQPNGGIVDVAMSSTLTQNRLSLRIASGTITMTRWDSTIGNTWSTALTLTTATSPVVGSVTWLRDVPIFIRCTWDTNQQLLSAGGSNAITITTPGSWAPSDTALARLTIGTLADGSAPFDGLIGNLEFDQLGAPTT